jgi:uncharacterized membrane protein YqhA
MMLRLLAGTRYLILVPILGLALASAFFFVFGGIALIRILLEYTLALLGLASNAAPVDEHAIIIDVVNSVHTFLVGTVFYLTGIGLFQLFIEEVDVPKWMKIENTEDLETNLVGMTVVVLAVNFMGEVFTNETQEWFAKGVGIALPIAALGVFIGLRAWAKRTSREPGAPDATSDSHQSANDAE